MSRFTASINVIYLDVRNKQIFSIFPTLFYINPTLNLYVKIHNNVIYKQKQSSNVYVEYENNRGFFIIHLKS